MATHGAGRLDLIETFVAIADDLSFRRAAERLSIDQSAASRRVRRLEQEIGFTLLERSTREVLLTPAGRAFHARGREILEKYDDAVRVARDIGRGMTGRIRIAYMAFAAIDLLPLAVARFRREHPDVEIDLVYLSTQEQTAALARDEIDVGFLIGPSGNSDFRAQRLRREALWLVAPKDHPLLAHAAVAVGDLARTPLVMGDLAHWEAYRRQLDDTLRRNGVRIDVAMEAPNTLALLGHVAAGIGVTVYPKTITQLLGPGFGARPIEGEGLTVDTVLVRRSANRSEPILRFMETASAVAADDPPPAASTKAGGAAS